MHLALPQPESRAAVRLKKQPSSSAPDCAWRGLDIADQLPPTSLPESAPRVPSSEEPAHHRQDFSLRLEGSSRSADGDQMPIVALMPPSTTSVVPVTKPASSEARKTAAFAASQASPMRPRGVLSSRCCHTWCGSSETELTHPSSAGVRTTPSTIVLARMPFGAYWSATVWVNWITAALLDA